MRFELMRTSMERPLWCAAVVLLIVGSAVLAGCGGGSDDRLSHEEFLKQGNAICADANEHIEAAGSTAFASAGKPTEGEIVAFAKTIVLPTVQDMLDELRVCHRRRTTRPPSRRSWTRLRRSSTG